MDASKTVFEIWFNRHILVNTKKALRFMNTHTGAFIWSGLLDIVSVVVLLKNNLWIFSGIQSMYTKNQKGVKMSNKVNRRIREVSVKYSMYTLT